MEHEDAFLKDEIAHMIDPDRQPIFEAEFMQIIGRAKMKLATGALFRAEGNDVVIRETQKFRNVTPHHHTTVRRRQRRDEQAMVTPGDRTRDRAGGEAAESIGHKPFAGEEQLARMARFVPWQRSGGKSHFVSESKNR